MDWCDVFPNLAVEGYQIESPPTKNYNCIAWAANQTDKWWWPGPGPPYYDYWPPNIPRQVSNKCFIEAFQLMGYEPCEDPAYEAGYEKVALYVDASGEPTHMARQLPNGGWTSKLGESHDIRHETLHGLEGEAYGHITLILKRPNQKTNR